MFPNRDHNDVTALMRAIAGAMVILARRLGTHASGVQSFGTQICTPEACVPRLALDFPERSNAESRSQGRCCHKLVFSGVLSIGNKCALESEP